jgi:exoribonuclease R
VIASVTGFFFVRLDELFIDGLVHVSSWITTTIVSTRLGSA